ncbi:Ras family protein [Aphelenchoides fujianensis]|nr:Ras family protein [Aphelenchoides fujianensis]
MHTKEFTVKGIPIALDILDTNINFPDMRRVAIASANAFIIVFGVDNVQSFKEMSDLWAEVVERRNDFREVPSIMAGNKSDTTAKKIYEATANAARPALGHSVTKIFSNLLELSAFPVGYDLPDPPIKQPPSRTGSQKDKLKKIKENSVQSDGRITPTEEGQLCEQISSGLTLPFDRLHVLRRNHSMRVFQITRNKNPDVPQPTAKDDHELRHKGSIIRRTKHLSLKLSKNQDDKRQADVENVPENQNYGGDCVVS